MGGCDCCSVYEWYAIVIAGLLTRHYHPEESGLTLSAYSESPLLLGQWARIVEEKR
jgi:hypothetical protein